MIRSIRTYLAKRRLERLVRQQRESFQIIDFKRRRAAMLRHTREVA